MISVFLPGGHNVEMGAVLQHVIMGFDYGNFVYGLSAGDFSLDEKNAASQSRPFYGLFIADGRGQVKMVAVFCKVMFDTGGSPFLFIDLEHLNAIDCRQHDGKQDQAGIESGGYSGIDAENKDGNYDDGSGLLKKEIELIVFGGKILDCY